MEPNDRLSDNNLIIELEANIRKYRFFQFYRLLSSTVDRSQIEFTAVNQYNFSTSDIRALKRDTYRGLWTVETTAFGLFSSSAYLPTSFTEIFEPYGKVQRSAVQAFLTKFETRLVSLFYDSRARYDSALLEQSEDHSWMEAVKSLSHSSSDKDLVEMAWFESMGRINRSVSAFEWICNRLIPFKTTILSLNGGYSEAPLGIRAQLGKNGFYKTLGRRIWQQDAEVVIKVDKISVRDILRFIPSGDLHPNVVALARKFFGQFPRVSFELWLEPQAQLPTDLGLGSDELLLGRTTFISGSSLNTGPIRVHTAVA